MRITIEHLVELVNKLDKELTYSYIIDSNPNKIKFVNSDSITGPLRFLRIKNNETDHITVTTENLNRLINGINENMPFNIDSIINASGSWRSLFEAILANTSEFYHCKINGIKHIVWIPSSPHEIGSLYEINITDIPEIPESDSLLPMKKRYELYMAGLGKSERTVHNYSSAIENKLTNEVKTRFGFALQSIFDINESLKVNDLYKRLFKIEEIIEYNDRGNNMYSCALKSYIDFLQAINNSTYITKQPINYLPSMPLTIDNPYRKYFTAIQTKPFILLAGISGTGKTRIVRELAKLTECSDPVGNYEMIQVRPNWHDSTELMGYVSRISDKPTYISTLFLKFLVKSWYYSDTPFFLCLDEMNLAPVEQYFAEYLSVIETRQINDQGIICTDPLLKKESMTGAIYSQLIEDLIEGLPATDVLEKLKVMFQEKGITIPPNFIVMGTVNMDETTYSFSRKVLDRAMTIEMNEVSLKDKASLGIIVKDSDISKSIDSQYAISRYAQGRDIYPENIDFCNKVLDYLESVNTILDGTPFKIAYRTRNEFLIYCYINSTLVTQTEIDIVLENCLDEMTSMKILSRIEGESERINSLLERLKTVVKHDGISFKKITEMIKNSGNGYVNYW